MARPRATTTAVATRIERLEWERQPGETEAPWAAFVIFRDLTSSRTIQRAAEITAETRRGTADSVRTQFTIWAKKYRWRERAEAYDIYLDRRRREARETEMEAIDRRQMQEGQTLQTAGMRRIVGDARAGVIALEPNTMDWSDAFRSIELGTRMERNAAGLPTDVMKAASMVPHSEVVSMFRIVMDVVLPFIPEERHTGALLAVEAALSGR